MIRHMIHNLLDTALALKGVAVVRVDPETGMVSRRFGSEVGIGPAIALAQMPPGGFHVYDSQGRSLGSRVVLHVDPARHRIAAVSAVNALTDAPQWTLRVAPELYDGDHQRIPPHDQVTNPEGRPFGGLDLGGLTPPLSAWIQAPREEGASVLRQHLGAEGLVELDAVVNNRAAWAIAFAAVMEAVFPDTPPTDRNRYDLPWDLVRKYGFGVPADHGPTREDIRQYLQIDIARASE